MATSLTSTITRDGRAVTVQEPDLTAEDEAAFIDWAWFTYSMFDEVSGARIERTPENEDVAIQTALWVTNRRFLAQAVEWRKGRAANEARAAVPDFANRPDRPERPGRPTAPTLPPATPEPQPAATETPATPRPGRA